MRISNNLDPKFNNYKMVFLKHSQEKNRIQQNSIFLTVFFFIVLIKNSYSQDPQYNEVTPASPTAQAFMRYGEIPVDYSTGVPNISVPIYTVNGSELEIPISISYHASGIKVNDVASEVGLGWTLNAGGLISRTINDLPDESNSGNRLFYDALQFEQWVRDQAYTVNGGNRNIPHIEDFFYNKSSSNDLMSDRFFYRLATGESGVFTYNFNNQNLNENNIIMLPYKPYKIKNYISTSGSFKKIDFFEIVDDNGITHKYQYHPSSSITKSSEWFLTDMISSNKKDTISFTYSNHSTASFNSYSSFLEGRVQNLSGAEGECEQVDSGGKQYLSQNPSQNYNFGSRVLTSIRSSKVELTLEYEDRLDFNGLKRLKKIKIAPSHAPTNYIKTFTFNQSYFGTTNADRRLKLNNVIIESPGASEYEKYDFVYESMMLPAYHSKSSSTPFSIDFWGYYNGSNSMSLIPKDFVSAEDQSINWGNREADNGYFSKACMLKEIKYPTGGKTVFNFERNYDDYVYPHKSSQGGYYGGFRVQSITNYNSDTYISDIKTYEYEGARTIPITWEYFRYKQDFNDVYSFVEFPGTPGEYTTVCNRRWYREQTLSDPLLPLEIAPGLPIFYSMVTEYNGTVNQHEGKTVYNYDLPYYTDSPSIQDEVRYYHQNRLDKGNYSPNLKSKTVYSLDNGLYHKLTRDENNYAKMYSSEFQTGFKITRTGTWDDLPISTITYSGLSVEDYIFSIVARDTKAIQESYLLVNSKRYVYDPTDSTKYQLSTVDYQYNPINLKPREQLSTGIDNRQLRKILKYPSDYNSEPYLTMKNLRNILSPVIEEIDYWGVATENNLIKRNKTVYSFFNNDSIIAPIKVESQKRGEVAESKINFVSYKTPHGNLTELELVGGIRIVYLWGYFKQQYPIAKIENSTLAEVESTLTAAELSGIQNGLYSESVLKSKLDKIRLGLPNAMVTTYTHNPLIGLTSITDPRGKETSYQYDDFKRLKAVLDDDLKFLQEYKYHYKGQN